MEKLEERRLANGLAVAVWDLSKKIAGDRWLVKIHCQTLIPVAEEFFLRLQEADSGLLEEVRARMGEQVAFDVIKERNFVDEAEKDAILKAMVEQVSGNMVRYLANPKFPEKFFSSKYEELRKACLVERHYRAQGEEDEEEGPADFSSCFRE